jgi:peptidoglycan/xylan/chitin deacetylase (PgdA/CDA1 family)
MATKTKKKSHRTRISAHSKRLQSHRKRISKKLREYRNELVLLLVACVMLLIGTYLQTIWQAPPTDYTVLADDGVTQVLSSSLAAQLQHTKSLLGKFEDAEAKDELSVVPEASISAQLGQITTDINNRHYADAHEDLVELNQSTAKWTSQLNTQLQARKLAEASVVAATTTPATANSDLGYIQVPIIMYHYTPSDFATQLQTIQSKGYTTITMGDLISYLDREVNPPQKSVVITFDDGYENQMQAFSLLEQYHMYATFYIIDGGPKSNWCIGAGRQYNLPSQPPGGCGDGYLTWDQVRQLDKSGLIDIGFHTIDHPDLITLSPDEQWYEINSGKSIIESELGHPVYDFAYPYGDFDATTISLVERAGFRSAVTTVPGVDQSYGSQYTLHRIRSAYELP